MMIQKVKIRFLMFILSLMLIAFTFSITIYAQEPENPIIEIDPAKIEVMIKTEDILKIPNATLYITARQNNLTKVSINSTDLFEEQNRRFWIPADSITFSNNHFDLTDGHTINVKVDFSLPPDQEAGAYVGRIKLRSENGGVAEIPITIKLRDRDLVPFVLIAAGVISNLIISISRWNMEVQDSAKAAIELADTAIYKAEDEQRRDDRYTRALDLQTQYRKDFKNGDYKEAKKKADRAKFEADQAKTPQPPAVAATLPMTQNKLLELLNKTGPIWETTALKIASKTNLVAAMKQRPDLILITGKYAIVQPTAPPRNRWERVCAWAKHQGNWIKSSLEKIGWIAKKQGLVYLTLTIIIGIVMLQAWEAFYPRILDFGASSIDLVTAFLYGFSGQSFLSAFADLGKRWLA